MNRELSNTGEHARECLKHAANMMRCVHVGRVETGNHRIETALLLFGERLVSHRDRCVGEGIVVQRRVCVEIVRRSAVSVRAIRPLLLERNPKNCYSPNFVSHDLQEVVNVSTLLDVVGKMKMYVIRDWLLSRIVLSGSRTRPNQQ